MSLPSRWTLSPYPPSLHLLDCEDYQIGETPTTPYPDHHACPDSYPSGTKFCIILKIPLDFIYPSEKQAFKILNTIDFDMCSTLAKGYLEEYSNWMLLDADHEFETHCIMIKILAYSWHPKLHAVAPGARIPSITIYDQHLVQQWLQS